MEMPDGQPPTKAGPLTKFLIRIAAADEATLQLCPEQDWNNVRAVAEIMICTWLYQAALFGGISDRLFAVPGHIRPELVLASMFIATFILLIDSYMVMRSGWHLSGIEELKRGGIDISGGPGARIKAGLFLAIRIFLSICIAQLTAIFLSIIIFASDIDARTQSAYLQANAHLLPAATALVDGEIQRATATVAAETAREAALSDQVATLRQNQIDPSANDPAIRQAQQEVSQLLAQQAKAGSDVASAEKFASDELGGIKGAPGNSGIEGSGPKRAAAMEQLANAKNRAQQIDAALAAAQSRLDALRTQTTAASPIKKKLAADQLPGFQDALAAEATRLIAARNQLTRLTQGRDEAIRAAVDNAPNHVDRDNGFLRQVSELEHIAQGDSKIALVILLIDLTSFGFELASVLAKVTSFVPTTYAALLARDSYMSAVRIVDDMMSELSDPTTGADSEFGPPRPRPQANTGPRGNGAAPSSDPFASADGANPKRRRGRPPKDIFK